MAASRGFAILVAAALIGPATAQAGGVQEFQQGALTYVRSSGQVPSGDDSNFVSTCPANQRLVGGGSQVNAKAASGTINARLTSIAPQDTLADGDTLADDLYLAQAHNASAEQRKQVTWGVCWKNSAGGSSLSYAMGQNNLSGPTGTGDIVPCPTGKLTGGGVHMEAADGTHEFPNSSHPDDQLSGDGVADDQWETKYNWQGGGSTTVETHAICAGEGQIKYQRKARVVFPDRKTTMKVACPKGARAVGGGSQGFFNAIVASTPFDGGDEGKVPEDGWKVTVWNNPAADPAALVTHAICLKP